MSSCIVTIFPAFQRDTLVDLSLQAIAVAKLSYPKLPISGLVEQDDFSLEVVPDPPKKDVPFRIDIRYKGKVVKRLMSFDPDLLLSIIVNGGKAYLLAITSFEGTLRLANAPLRQTDKKSKGERR